MRMCLAQSFHSKSSILDLPSGLALRVSPKDLAVGSLVCESAASFHHAQVFHTSASVLNHVSMAVCVQSVESVTATVMSSPFTLDVSCFSTDIRPPLFFIPSAVHSDLIHAGPAPCYVDKQTTQYLLPLTNKLTNHSYTSTIAPSEQPSQTNSQLNQKTATMATISTFVRNPHLTTFHQTNNH